MMKAPCILVFAAGAALAPGCSNQITTPSGGTGGGAGSSVVSSSSGSFNGSTGTGTGGACGATASLVDVTHAVPARIDLVLVVDNSASMADKQAILALAVPDLIRGLVNPPCLDDVTGLAVGSATQPTSPLGVCPTGSTREFAPVLDIHIGLLSSSLGSFGADGCPETPPLACNGTPGSTSNDDHGHLVTRTDPCATTSVPTYQSEGFLAWDPAQEDQPPGEASLGDPSTMMPGLMTSLTNLVIGDGQLGCGFESQNESWYRFLVDPTPYAQIALDAQNNVQTSGLDTALLAQRQEFLRPDSLLAVINVTDETDTSLKEYSSFPLFAEPSLHLPHARSECTSKGPDDPCCASCGQTAPIGCPADAGCTSDPYYTNADENTALRAFGLISHKARYGIEFFYPPSRYVAALTSATVANNLGTMVQNPIYSVLDPVHDPGPVRDPTLVFYAAIVGVPWQLIARQTAAGVPDLINGVNALDPSQVGGFKTAAELDLLDGHGHTFWDDIAGDPEHYVAALSPYMVESTVPRNGTDPITGITMSPPTAASGADPINGHERTIALPAGDIEYACTFPIQSPIDCTDPSVTACDCRPGQGSGNPLCAPNPNDSMNPTLQVAAKAYPGIKHLAIVKGMGDQGIAASICAKQITDSSASDFGYRPAITAIVDRLRGALGGRCLTEPLSPGAQGQVACSVIEARSTGGACSCDAAKGRVPVPSADACYQSAVEQNVQDPLAHWDCFCEIPQTSGAAQADCQTDLTSTSNGWCYVDVSAGGNPALVKGCPSTSQRTLRFVGDGAPVAGASVFLACQ